MKLWPTGGLWRHPDFVKLWSAETVSQFGTQFTQLALPLAAIDVLHASAFEVAALTTVEFLPFLLVSLPAGVWVDRLRRRPMLVVGDLARAVLLASVPIAYAFDALTMWQLYVVGFFVGIATVFFDVAYQSYLPSLVERDQLIDGNAKLEISRAAAQLGGPGLAGVVIQALKAPAAIAFDAVSFVGSALFIFRIRKEERSPQAEGPRRPHAGGAPRGPPLRLEASVPEEHRRVHGAVQLLREPGLRRAARVRAPRSRLEPARDRARAHGQQRRPALRRVQREPNLVALRRRAGRSSGPRSSAARPS